MMRENEFARAFKMFGEMLDFEERLAAETGDAPEETMLLFSLKDRDKAERNYDLPAVNEVAAVYKPNSAGEAPPAYIVIEDRETTDLFRLKNFDKATSPLLYPLLFPRGTEGYDTSMRHDNGIKRLTMRQYVSHQIQFRPLGAWQPLRFAGLLQQAYLASFTLLFSAITFSILGRYVYAH